MDFEKMYSLHEAGKTDAALDVIFEEIDKLCTEGQWLVIDDILEEVDLDKIDTCLMMGFLTTSAWAKSKLTKRDAFYIKVEQAIIDMGEKDRLDDYLGRLK